MLTGDLCGDLENSSENYSQGNISVEIQLAGPKAAQLEKGTVGLARPLQAAIQKTAVLAGLMDARRAARNHKIIRFKFATV